MSNAALLCVIRPWGLDAEVKVLRPHSASYSWITVGGGCEQEDMKQRIQPLKLLQPLTCVLFQWAQPRLDGVFLCEKCMNESPERSTLRQRKQGNSHHWQEHNDDIEKNKNKKIIYIEERIHQREWRNQSASNQTAKCLLDGCEGNTSEKTLRSEHLH